MLFKEYLILNSDEKHITIPMENKPSFSQSGVPQKDFFLFSIFNILCCNVCLGIPALVYSVKTREANKHGRYQDASASSRLSKIFNIYSVLVGLLILALIIIIEFHLLNNLKESLDKLKNKNY